MKKALFIDRDGTLVIEPPIDFQLDSLEKLEFYPGVFQWLSKIYKELDYELVMVTNQDGLGTKSFPECDFWPAQNKILKSFSNEGVFFGEILIDKSFPEENSPTRKPRTGLLNKYIYGNYDLSKSFVIGDRDSDIELASNLKAKGIKIGKKNKHAVLNTNDWKKIYSFLKEQHRTANFERNTLETSIKVRVDLDGNGASNISTGIGFFNHMLSQIAKHGELDLNIEVKGDLNVDEHHTIEDVAISLGSAIKQALGSKRGIERYGFLLPMDDSLAQVALDFGGRPWLVWNAEFNREKIGEMPTEMFMHFFKSFSDASGCNLNIQANGGNEHHKIEAIFKAFAKALKMAKSTTANYSLPTTKGVL